MVKNIFSKGSRYSFFIYNRTKYNLKLIASETYYQFLVDDRVIMSDSDTAIWYRHGGLALISYDWQGDNDLLLKGENL